MIDLKKYLKNKSIVQIDRNKYLQISHKKIELVILDLFGYQWKVIDNEEILSKILKIDYEELEKLI